MVLNIVFLSLSALTGLSFILLLLSSGEFQEYISPLNKKDFMLPEIYGVGFKVLKLTKFDYKTRGANQMREHVVILYGERYADYYLRVVYAQRISIVYLCFAIGCGICALANGSDKLVLLALVTIVCVALYMSLGKEITKKIKNRGAKMLDEFPNAVSTLALLVNSGMILREAWREVSMTNDSELYLEMRRVNEDIDNGVAEVDALFGFGNRCNTPEIKRFTSFIVQGLEKGSRDLTYALKNQTDEMWELKKQNTLKRGALASSKLMIPLMIMFLGILIMVMGPILTNLGL